MKKSGLADSPFFTPPSSVTVSRVAGSENVFPPPSERNSERTLFRSENRTVDLPIKRRTKRYSFEFYEDQLTKLKKLKYQADISGESLSLSDMVRQALDRYLQNQDG
jgi:hypothetical protein